MFNENDFAYIHIRPRSSSNEKEHPVATVALCLVAEDDYAPAPHRFAVGFAAQHIKKDRQWNAEMGRRVARGRAEKSVHRVHIHANPNTPRRDLIILAVGRVLEAVESGELFATKRVTRALQDTIDRLVDARIDAEHKRQYADLAAE